MTKPTDDPRPAGRTPPDAAELLARVREVARRITERVRAATRDTDPDLALAAGGPPGGGPVYRVCAFGPADPEQRSFAGTQAFAAAGEWYELLAADPAVVQLWLIRRDGRGWQFVDGQVRGDDGGWEPVRPPDPARPADDTATAPPLPPAGDR